MRILNLVLLVVLVALQVRLWSGHGSLPAGREMRATLAAQQRENGELAERNLALAAEVVDLKNGLDAVEERARSEMGMIRDGETFYQVIDPGPAGAPAAD